MDKRYQVFVSSTYSDLIPERSEVMQALLELECMPAGMELFPAANDTQWEWIKKVIDESDYYIVIVGGRYGTVSKETGQSYTEMEYRYALETGKPVIGFLHEDPSKILAKYVEQSSTMQRKLESFRDLVKSKLCKFYSSPSDLGSKVSRSITQLRKQYEAVGWVRADLLPDESATDEILKLRKRVEELEQQLESARVETPKGTEELAQGDDSFKIRFDYWITKGGDPEGAVRKRPEIDTTWNNIFSFLSPYMISEVSEGFLREKVNYFISHDLRFIFLPHKKDEEISDPQITDNAFNMIKVQLYALGLIRKSEGVRDIKDNTPYWTLTPYGENIMTKLRAIKRG